MRTSLRHGKMQSVTRTTGTDERQETYMKIDSKPNVLKIRKGLIRELGVHMSDAGMRGKALLVTDNTVWGLYGEPVEEAM